MFSVQTESDPNQPDKILKAGDLREWHTLEFGSGVSPTACENALEPLASESDAFQSGRFCCVRHVPLNTGGTATDCFSRFGRPIGAMWKRFSRIIWMADSNRLTCLHPLMGCKLALGEYIGNNGSSLFKFYTSEVRHSRG